MTEPVDHLLAVRDLRTYFYFSDYLYARRSIGAALMIPAYNSTRIQRYAFRFEHHRIRVSTDPVVPYGGLRGKGFRYFHSTIVYIWRLVRYIYTFFIYCDGLFHSYAMRVTICLLNYKANEFPAAPMDFTCLRHS